MARWIAICLLLAGCSTAPDVADSRPASFRQRNEGYSILYKLLSVDSGVSNIFLLKHANDSLVKVVNQISDFCQNSKSQLDAFARADGSLAYDAGDLPAVEFERRNLMTDADTHELLTLSGEKFEVRLIVTQQQAMEYAAQLSKALAEHENNPTRKKFLTDLSQKSQGFADQLVAMLAVKS